MNVGDLRKMMEAQGNGRRTIMADYCQRKLEAGVYQECVLVCLKRGRRYQAIDVPIQEGGPDLGLERLRKASGGWWKRYSLHSTVAVQAINIRLMEIERPDCNQPDIRVCALQMDDTIEISQYEKSIRDILLNVKRCRCFTDINGIFHADSQCSDPFFDDLGFELGCRTNYAHNLEKVQSDYVWLPSMIEYYWHNGFDEKGVTYLRSLGFVHHYKNLQYDKWHDAATTYGQTIKAFLLIEGWHIRRLLGLIGFSLSASACIIAVVAGFTRSIETALTAGSYLCGLVAALIALFTLLSAVLKD